MDPIIGGGGGLASAASSVASGAATTATTIAMESLETTATPTTDDDEADEEEDEDDIAVAAEAAANALEGADAVAKFTTGDDDDDDGSFVVDHHHHHHDDGNLPLPHQQLHHLLGAVVAPPPIPIPPPPSAVAAGRTPALILPPPPPVVLVPAGPCRICGQPAPSSTSNAGNGDTDDGRNNSRPMIRFFPTPGAISPAVAKAAPSVTTFGQDICLHVFCGKTAGFLPGRSDPELEIMTKAGLKNKHGIGQEVNAALARTRCGVPILTQQQMQEQQQQQQQEHLEQQLGGDGDNCGIANGLLSHELSAPSTTTTILCNGAITTTTTTTMGGKGKRPTASAAASAAKERQFYLVREFEAHLAAIRNKTITFAYEKSSTSKSRARSAPPAPPATSAVTVQHKQHHRPQHQHHIQLQQQIHELDAHSHLTSSIPIVLPPARAVGSAIPLPSNPGTNPGPPLLSYNLTYPYSTMNGGGGGVTSATSASTDPFHLEQHYAAEASQLYMHYAYPPYIHHPIIVMNNQQPEQQQQPSGSVNGTSSSIKGGGNTQATSETKSMEASAFATYVQQPPTAAAASTAATAPPAGQPLAPVLFPGHQPLALPPMTVGVPVGVATGRGTATAGRGGGETSRPKAAKAAAGKTMQKASLRASSRGRVLQGPAVVTGASVDVNATTTHHTTGLRAPATAASAGSPDTSTAFPSENGGGDYDHAVDASTPVSFLGEDGKVRCDCGGTHAVNDGTYRGVASWRNHALTKRHQRWLESLGGNGNGDLGTEGKNIRTTTTTQQSNGNGTIP
jgi:hypothetical protein